MNYIFGSGIVGLLARKILGPSYKVVPFYKSRFYSFNPALDDNFIIRDERIDTFISELTSNKSFMLYKRAYSILGDLKRDHNKEYDIAWLTKIFGTYPSQSEVYMKDRLSFFVYDIRINKLYESLVNEFNEELQQENSLGPVTEVGDHYFIRNKVRYDYDKLVSTVPLDILLKLMGKDASMLRSKPLHYLHVASNELDFEKSNQLLILDDNIDFYKVTNIAPDRYLFYFHKDVEQPGVYLMNFIRSFDIIDGTAIESALPVGERPKLDNLEKADVFCVGSNAQWDWCMDVGSCILRLLKYSNRDERAITPKTIVKF